MGCSNPQNSEAVGGADAGASPDGSGAACVGVNPDSAKAENWKPNTPASCKGKPASCVGTPMLDWKLKDFQPQSCGYEKVYGNRAFRGKVTVVVLLAAWCGFCQAQTEKLERMRLELASKGKDVHFLIVNANDAEKEQQEFVKRTAIPLFQDTTSDKVWEAVGGKKDDMYIYDSKGYLAVFLPFGGEVDINLSASEGYNNLMKAIMETK